MFNPQQWPEYNSNLIRALTSLYDLRVVVGIILSVGCQGKQCEEGDVGVWKLTREDQVTALVVSTI